MTEVKHIITPDMEVMLKKIALALPPLKVKEKGKFFASQRVHLIRGKHMIEAGIERDEQGFPTDYGKLYKLNRPLHVDHVNRIKHAYSIGGKEGVEIYVADVKRTAWRRLPLKIKWTIIRARISKLFKKKTPVATGVPDNSK